MIARIIYIITFLSVLSFSVILNNIIIFAFFLSLFFVIALRFNYSKQKNILLTIFCINILFNILLNRIYVFEYGEPYFMGGSDDKIAYEDIASWMLNEYGLKPFEFISNGLIFHNSILYVYIVAIFMEISNFFGAYYTIIPVFFNSFILVFTANKFFTIAKEYYNLNSKESRKITLWFVFFPLVIFMNSHVFRDTIVNFLIINLIFLLIFKNKIKWLKIIFIIFLMALLRIEYAIFFTLISIVSLISAFLKTNGKIKFFYYSIFVCFILILLLNASFFTYLQSEMEKYDLVRVNKGSTLIASLFSLPLYLRIPAKFLFLLVNPTPSFGTIEQTFLGLGTIIQFLFTPITFYAVSRQLFSKNIIPVTFVLMFLMIGLISVDAKHKYSLIMLGVIPTFIALKSIKFKI